MSFGAQRRTRWVLTASTAAPVSRLLRRPIVSIEYRAGKTRAKLRWWSVWEGERGAEIDSRDSAEHDLNLVRAVEGLFSFLRRH